MPRVAFILGISFAACLVLSGNWLQVSAQAPNQSGSMKFDEFGSIGHCDLTARLDNFAIQIQSDPRSRAYVIAYAPEASATNDLKNIKDYLVMTRGLQAERLKTIYGGRNNNPHEPKIELWIAAKGVPRPEPEKYETNIGSFKGLFSDEITMWDDFGLDYSGEDFEGMGPGIGKTTLPSFAEMLHQQKDTIAYVVTYNGEDATPGAWRRVAEYAIAALKKFNLDASRFKTVFGGQREETRVQFWILPKDAPAPVADAGPESPPLKTVKGGDFYSDALAKEQNQVKLFTRLTEILREHKTARVFLVVHLPQPIAVEESEGSEAPAVDEPSMDDQTPEVEEVDLTKLVEKWRVELAKKYNIGDDRFITLTTPAINFDSNVLSLWIVPRGQALPDPNEEYLTLDEEARPQPLPAVTGKRP